MNNPIKLLEFVTMINGDYLAIQKPLLYLHIFAGFISLGVAYFLLFTKKGN